MGRAWTDEPSFLQAVIAAPEDDFPRLAYADWMEEQGAVDRAAFVRVQCALARLGPDDEARWPLEAAERRALAFHARQWKPPWIEKNVKSSSHSRGFIERAKMGVGKFLSHGGPLRELAPLRHLELTWPIPVPFDPGAFARSSAFDGLESLDLSDLPIRRDFHLTGDADREMARTMERIAEAAPRELELGANETNWLTRLPRAAWPFETIRVGTRGPVPPYQVGPLAQLGWASSVRSIRATGIGPLRLARSRLLDRFERLESLELFGGNGPGPAHGLDREGSGSGPGAVNSLRDLTLHEEAFAGPGGLAEVMAAPRTAQLRSLSLIGQGQGHFANVPFLYQVPDDLALAPPRPSLRRLRLENVSLQRGQLTALAESGAFPRLEELALLGALERPIFVPLIHSPWSKTLRRLSVRGESLRLPIVKDLEKSGLLERLVVLRLDDVGGDAAPIEWLAGRGPWPLLGELEIDGWRYTKGVRDLLSKSFGPIVRWR